MKHIEITVNGIEYRLTASGSRFDLFKLGTTEKGKPTEQNIAYHITLSSAIDKIAKTSMSKPDEVLSLKEYVERYEASLNEVKELLTEIEF